MQTTPLLRLASALALATAATGASAQVIFDSAGFDGPAYSAGALTGQNSWTADSPPGSAAVVDLGGNQVVQATGGTTNWFFPSVNYTPAADMLVVVEADISRTLGSPTSSFGYAIDLYNESVSRVGRFGLVDNGGVIQIFVSTKVSASLPDASGTAGNLAFGSAISADQFVHFEVALNYATQTFRVKADSLDLGYDFPFVNASTQLADADFQVSSTTGANDYGRLDNYLVYATAIPEPSAFAALAGLAALALGATRRRR